MILFYKDIATEALKLHFVAYYSELSSPDLETFMHAYFI